MDERARRFQFVNHRGQRIICDGKHTYVAQPGAITAERIPDDQQWFWTPEWQDGEREADEAIAAGDVVEFGSNEELRAWLSEGLGEQG